MKKIILIGFILFTISCKAQHRNELSTEIDSLSKKIIELEKKNDELSKLIYETNLTNKSSTELIDKVDNLYNNNFNRFILFWGMVASLITIGIPYYITRIQKKIIDAKKAEIINFSTTEINKLESNFSSELTKKYEELSDLINNSNQENKEELSKEFTKTFISNLYIASKINELDKKFNKVFINLSNAVIKSISIEYYTGANFHLKNILENLIKFETEEIILNKEPLIKIAEKFKTLRDIDEVDQDVLESVIEKLI